MANQSGLCLVPAALFDGGADRRILDPAKALGAARAVVFLPVK